MIIHFTIMITEIMFDPEPAVGLPGCEYVEWFNPGNDTVDLTGWKWITGGGAEGSRIVRTVRQGRILPGEYLVVCSPSSASQMDEYGNVLALESFPALRNSGDWLTVADPSGIPVHTVEYSPDFHGDVLRANGGWSLELVDPSQPCSPQAWFSSVDPAGGTPGRKNSASVSLAPPEPPFLVRAAMHGEDEFLLLFDGSLLPGLNFDGYSCVLNPGGHAAAPASTGAYGFPGLFFRLPAGFDQSVVYTVEINGMITGCSGHAARCRPVPFGFPGEVDSADLAITEVLFDPWPGQPEFVEVYNRSAHPVELADIILARAEPWGEINSISDEQELSYLLFPGGYAVITDNYHTFRSSWPDVDPAGILQRTDLPALSNEETILYLLTRSADTIDAAGYSPGWQYPYLTDSRGVSLERIDFSRSGIERSNWFSSSSENNFTTPGRQNSVVAPESSPGSGFFSLLDPVGHYELATDPADILVQYSFDSPGWFARVVVCNSSGQTVRELQPFLLMGRSGVLRWDGLDSQSRLVPDGIYIILSEYRHPSGGMGRWKKACAVVRAH